MTPGTMTAHARHDAPQPDRCRARLLPAFAAMAATFVGLLVLATPAAGQPAATPRPTSWRMVLQDARDEAIQEVITAARSDNALYRMSAIEAMQPLPSRALPLAQLGMEDENPAVRFAALVTIGKLQLRSLGPVAAQMADDPAPAVRAAALFAAHQCGQDVDLTAFAQMLASPSPSLRGNAALLLGMMGEASAIPMLEEMARVPMRTASNVSQSIVRLQVAEAIVKLGDDSPVNAMRAGIFSSFDEVRLLSILMVGRVNDKLMIPVLEGLLEPVQPGGNVYEPIEVRLAAAQALAELGRDTGLDILLKGAAAGPEWITAEAEKYLKGDGGGEYARYYQRLIKDAEQRAQIGARIRSQAAFGLAMIKDRRAAAALVKLLNDPEPSVRLAAAASVLKALGPEQQPVTDGVDAGEPASGEASADAGAKIEWARNPGPLRRMPVIASIQVRWVR